MSLGVLLLCFLSLSFAQSDVLPMNDSITLGAQNGYPLKYQGEVVTMKKLGELFADNPNANLEFDAAKTNQTLGMIFAYSGGFMLGWTLGTAIGGGDPNWALAGAGAACIIIAIPLATAAKKRTLQAVELYNAGLSQVEASRLQLNIAGGKDGLGLVLRF